MNRMRAAVVKSFGGLVATGLASSALSLAAQEPLDGVSQIGTTEDAAAVSQVGTAATRIEPPSAHAPASAAPPPQLTPKRDGALQTPQLTSERGAGLPAQLYRGGRTAQPSSPLSSTAEGRTGAVAPVHGQDRCDSAAATRPGSAVCANVIETRAAEFTRPDPAALSPEQRLLSERPLPQTPTNGRSAARSLAQNSEDFTSLAAQEVAAMALSREAAAQDEAAAAGEQDAAAAAAAAALGGDPASSAAAVIGAIIVTPHN